MEDRTPERVSLGRYIWASPHVHAILVLRGKANTPALSITMRRKRATMHEHQHWKDPPCDTARSSPTFPLTVRRVWLKRETWHDFAFYAFALGDLGWGDDLYYGATRLFAALTVCHFLSESVALRVAYAYNTKKRLLDSQFCT